jgi:tetratricopeptide (TPR) repeat protein/class 3 adenylate cyclase
MPQQRKQVTVLFINIDGLSLLAEEMRSGSPVNALWQQLAEIIHLSGGQANRPAADNAIAVFGVPTAREDDPERAVRAALALQAALSAFCRQYAWACSLPMRIAINTGPILYDTLKLGGFMAVGDAITVAGALLRLLPDEAIVATHETYRAVRGVFDVDSLPPLEIPGRKEAVDLYRVKLEKPRAFHFSSWDVEGVETQLVGRDSEMAQLQALLGTAVEQRQTTIVTILGETGVGKSRLLYEFTKWVELLPELYWLWQVRASQANCEVPYAFLREMFSARFEIQDSDSTAVAREKLEKGFSEFLGTEGVIAAHFVGQLLGFDFSDTDHVKGLRHDSQQIRNRAFHYGARLFAAGAGSPGGEHAGTTGGEHAGSTGGEHAGTLLFLDDLQWADAGSMAFIDHLVKTMPGLPLLIVGLTRPPLLWGESWPVHTRLRLPLLDAQQCRQLVQNILRKVPELPAQLLALIVERAEGNPYYVEEVIRMLLEDKVIVPAASQWQVALDRLEKVSIPSTLTGVLQAALDALTPPERDVLERAAVVGRVFWDQAVTFLHEADQDNFVDNSLAQTGQALRSLRDRGLILKHKESAFAGVEEYSFKHTILHEVTYEEMLRWRQRLYHARAAQWYLDPGGERSAYAAVIARHLELAGESERAAVYLAQAGQQAAAQFANTEAVTYLSRALELTPADDWPARYILLMAREQVYGVQGARERQKQDLLALAALVDCLNEDHKRAEALLRHSYFADSTGDYPAALAAAAEVIRLAQVAGAQTLAASGHLHWGTTLWRQGQHESSRFHLEQALSLAQSLDLPKVEADALRILGNVVLRAARLEEADRYYQQALQIYRQTGDRKGETSTLSNMGIVARQSHRIEQSRQFNEQALQLSREMGFRISESVLLNNLGVMYIDQGFYEKAKDHYERSLAIKREIEDRDGEALVLGNIGLIYHQLDENETACRYCREALAIAREIGGRHVEASALTNLSHALMALAEHEEASHSYGQALALRREMGQHKEVQQPLAGLARVALVKGQLAQALTYVEELLTLFTAGQRPDSSVDPFRIYLACYEVLAAARDPRAGPLLQMAYDLLQAEAGRFTDPEVRCSFLENVPAHRAIMTIWAAAAVEPQA